MRLYVCKEMCLEDYIRIFDDDDYEKEVFYMPYSTCGECVNFVKDEKGSYGICKKREFLIDRHGGFQNRKFYPYQSRKACKNDFEQIPAETVRRSQ